MSMIWEKEKKNLLLPLKSAIIKNVVINNLSILMLKAKTQLTTFVTYSAYIL